MIGLSLIPGLVYVFFGWMFDIVLPAVVWYVFLIVLSVYGWFLYREFISHKMDEEYLKHWYNKLIGFMYVMFSSWSVIFVLYVDQSDNNLHYIAIFTQLGASVVASTLLVSDKKLFVPILLTLMLPLSFYFFLIGAWYGYILAAFSLIFLSVLLYGAYNTNRLLEENYFNAQHDVLTGLYNRRYFMDYMEPLNDRLEEGNKIAYIYLIDLDHFKTINDSLGHDIGDKLLIEVSKRIASFVDDKYMLARLGGDEFILVSQDTVKTKTNKEEAYNFAMGILATIRNPYTIDKHQLYISASIGLHQLNPSTLYNKSFIKEVDIAMYEAKMKGRDGVIVFNKELEEKVERHLLIEQKLHHAIAEDKIEIYYQPQFDKNENIKGCEALLRWNDDELGYVSPNEFVPISENTGLILELGSYVLKNTFEALRQWNQTENTLKYFSINISMRQLLDEMFLDEVTYLMQHYFHDVELKQEIVFEITEHVFASDMKKV
ncbi:MAG: diguanylate cyclase, partial [Flavobacteriaceae bacterium]|nr:diguanylate cyclase [Flavobacteriaceae bacterium]